MSLFPSITAYKDGSTETVDASTLNVPINQLKERTDYLYQQLTNLMGTGPFESVRLNGVRLDPNDTVPVNSIVYIAAGTRYYSKALSDMLVTAVYPYSLGAETSYAVGMVTSVTGTSGTVVLYGKVDLSTVLLSTIIDSGEVFRDGPYYLSDTEPGKLTANPKGMAVFIGHFYASTSTAGYGDFAELAPQLKDLYEAHLHKHFVLASQPAGLPVATGTELEDTWTVRGFRPSAYSSRWASGGTYVMGNIIVPLAASENWHCYVCTVGGTAGGTEPTWPTTGGTVVDGGVTWQDYGVHALLNVRGTLNGLGDAYTFWIVSSTGLVKDTRLFWSTAAGTDNGWSGAPTDPDYGATIGLPINFYEKEIEIGSLGVRVSLELGGAFSYWSGTANFAEVPAGLIADSSATWTLAIPGQTKGWHAHKVSGYMTYTGSRGTPPVYAIQVFGTYVSQSGSSGENIKLAVTLAGDFAGAGPTIAVTDINDAAVCTFTNMAFSGPAFHVVKNVGGTDYYDLYMVVTRTDISGVPVVDTTATVADAWEFAFSDDAVNSKFEYNIGYDADLNAYYPPQPLLDVVLEVNGVNLDARDKFNAGLGSYKATNTTLYWYPDDYMEAPWPIDWTLPGVVGSQENLKNMLLYSAAMRAASAGLVTSLTPRTRSSVRLTDKRTGLPATTGDLEIDATFDVNTVDSNAAGFMVFKSVDEQGRILRGPVVEELRAGAGIRLTPSSGNGKAQGIVYIDSDIAGLTYGDFSDIFYLNAKSEVIPNRLFSYVKLLPWTTALTNNVPTAFVAKFRVPYSLTGMYRVLVYATIFGLDGIDGTAGDDGRKYAGLNFTYSVGPDYSLSTGVGVIQKNFSKVNPPNSDGVLENTIALVNDVTVGCTGSVVGSTKGYTAYDPFLLHNDPDMVPIDGQILDPFMLPFPLADDVAQQVVTAGNIVAVKFERANVHSGHTGSAVEYTSALGFISLKWKLIPVVT